jgi:hypothetical protein
MLKFIWNETKNERLRLTRGVGFKEVLTGRFLDVIEHPVRKDQQLMIFEYHGYCWVVPFIETGDGYFLKTIYPSRKFKKIYLG